MIDRAYVSSSQPRSIEDVEHGLRRAIAWVMPELTVAVAKRGEGWVVESSGRAVVCVRRKTSRMIEFTPAEGERFALYSGWVSHALSTELAKKWHGRRSMSREPKMTWSPDAFSVPDFGAWKKAWAEANGEVV